MENLTPQVVRERAALALVTISDVLKRAGVDPSVFYRWDKGKNEARLLTKARIDRALKSFEAEAEAKDDTHGTV